MKLFFHVVKALFSKKPAKSPSGAFCSHKLASILKKDISNDWQNQHLEAGHRSGGQMALIKLAKEAADPAMKLEAALALGDQSALTAIALHEWSIDRGVKAVAHIDNTFLLKRIARSANQDRIRLCAAEKTNDRQLIGRVAEKTADIVLRWKAARKLKDPLLFAGILGLRSTSNHHDMLRRTVRRELMHLLNRLQVDQNATALLTFFHGDTDPDLKLEAFVRLPTKTINASLLREIASMDMRYIPEESLRRLFLKIQACGWRTKTTIQRASCTHCDARGRLPYIYLIDRSKQRNDANIPCHDCNGTGTVLLKTVNCRLDRLEPILFRIPVATPAHNGMSAKPIPNADGSLS